MKKNVIVGQSGGPTSVINSSLAGVFKAARDLGAGKILGMCHGIQGLLDEKTIDLTKYITSDLDLELLKRTPASYLGACRFKLPEIDANKEMYEKIFSILEKLEVGYFFYIGGNDSMDTTRKLSDYAKMTGSDIKFMGVPKTIDNDLMGLDHAPGFGSAAKYIATSVKEVIRDGIAQAYNSKLVIVIEVMGRNAGWLTAASALAKGEDCCGPDMIFVPEVAFDMDFFMNKLDAILKTKDCVCIVVSEGIHLEDGTYVCEMGSSVDYVDSFGHKQLTSTASFLANHIAATHGCKTRAIEFSTLQRGAAHMASLVDINEAFTVGEVAVEAAMNGETGKVVKLERVSNDPYGCTTGLLDASTVSNAEKMVPVEWLDLENANVKPEFIEYARPLIQGELTDIMVGGIPRHLPSWE